MQGYEAHFYYDSTPLAGEPSTGTWTELTIVKDVNLGDEHDESDVTTRANNGHKATDVSLRDNPLDVEIAWDPDDAAFSALRTAYEGRLPIAIAVMDGPVATVGSKGVAGNYKITSFPRNEPLGDHVTSSVTLKPYSYMDDYEVAAP